MTSRTTCPTCSAPVRWIIERCIDNVVTRLAIPGNMDSAEIDQDETEEVLSTRYGCDNGHEWDA